MSSILVLDNQELIGLNSGEVVRVLQGWYLGGDLSDVGERLDWESKAEVLMEKYVYGLVQERLRGKSRLQ